MIDRAVAVDAVEGGARAYFNARRERVDRFVDAHFSFFGTLKLHRNALGWDIAKAPINLSLAAPQLLMHLGAGFADRVGARFLARLLHRSILLPTSVSREIEWLIVTELFELPFVQGARESRHDALSEAIVAEPVLEHALHGDDPMLRQRLARAMTIYAGARSAAAEITTGLMSLSAGALALNKITPGAASLGPALAAVMAQQTAVAAFPLGGWLGGVWYGLFPVAPTLGLVATTTGSLMVGLAIFAAFSGIVFDPIQRLLGLHRRRLMRMVDALERGFFDPRSSAFAVHDHYVARLLDMFDLVGAAVRL